ncbi:MAG TPA: G1 family glutamic endopeptidase [Frankiaceae bacterium]|nr:G1 family glutamic endopeptidase [Frankiaceae bacterium]
MVRADADGKGGVTYWFREPDGSLIGAPVPPAGWTPLAAPDAELAQYAFPARPADAVQLLQWQTTFRNYVRGGRPTLCVSDVRGSTSDGLLSIDPASGATGDNIWSGGVAKGGTYRYHAAQTSFVVPSYTLTCTDPEDELLWAGLRGYGTQSLIQAGVDLNKGNPFAWLEYISPASDTGVVAMSALRSDAPAFSTGDAAYAYVDYDVSKSWAHFTVRNSTTGATSTYVKALGREFYDSTSAEFIDERPQDLQTRLPYKLSRHSYANFSYAQGLDQNNVWRGGQTVPNVQLNMVSKTGVTINKTSGWTSTHAFRTSWITCG